MRTGHWLNLTERSEGRVSVLFLILDYSKNPNGWESNKRLTAIKNRSSSYNYLIQINQRTISVLNGYL